jgi:hypothetical protein
MRSVLPGIRRERTGEFMAVEHDRGGAGAASGEDAISNSEQRFREFISFFGSLVGLVGFGLGILPNSTTVEKFLVVTAAIALSCRVALAIRLAIRLTTGTAHSGCPGMTASTATLTMPPT